MTAFCLSFGDPRFLDLLLKPSPGFTLHRFLTCGNVILLTVECAEVVGEKIADFLQQYTLG